MSIDLFFADFDRMIQSPESVHRLRRFILDLAVRGKLVPQDPNDEPASELLKRIAAEKARLVKARKTRKQVPFPSPDASEVAFDLPSSWAWCPSTYPTYIVSDKGKKIQTKDVVETGKFPVVDQGKVLIRGFHNDASKVIGIKEPIVLFGDHTREVKLIDFDFVVGADGVKLFQPVSLHTAYYFLALQWLPLKSRGYGRHFKLLKASFIPLPPLAEQHRIVAKVDELMALCDRLEAARADREATRDRLATASLARLNAPDPDAARFQHDVAFALNNLGPLTTRPDQIKALRQTILNLAVRGNLVPQDAKEDRSNQGKLRSDTTAETYDVRAFEGRMALLKRPDNWTIEPLSRVSSHIVDCLHTTPKWTEEGVLCIKTNQVRAGQLDLSSPHFVSENTHKTRVNRLEPRQDDILYIREGGVLGLACIVPPNTRLCLGQRLMQIRANNAIAPQFLELCLNSPWITEFAAEKTTGGAAPRVNMSIVRSYPIPLPPLAEQHRIVAEVDELTALCDRLEASLVTGGEARRRLLEVLLYEAFMAEGTAGNRRADYRLSARP